MKNPKKSDRWDAKHYKKHSNTQFKGALATLKSYSFKGNEDILDIGCGDGKITAQIAKHIPDGSILGIDTSKNMIEVCKKDFGHIKNLTCKHVSAESFVATKTFDLIVSFSTFHWIKDQEKVITNIFDWLKPGGTLVIMTSGGNAPAIEKVFEKEYWQKELPVQTNETWHGKTSIDYQNMLKQAGFMNIKIETIQASRFFENKDAFIGYAMGWVPHVTGLPHDKALTFAQDLLDSVRTHMKTPDPDGKIELVSPLALIWAEKL